MSLADFWQQVYGITLEDYRRLPEWLQDVVTTCEYQHIKTMPDGSYACLHRFMFTWAILSDLEPMGYGDRWCFHNFDDAKEALDAWDGTGDPGDKWHRHPKTGRRRNEDGSLYVDF
jgi:hypothetical protein